MNLSRIFHCSVINVLCFAVVQQLLYLITEPSACQQLFYFSFFAVVQQLLYITRSKALCQQLFKIVFCCPLRNISASRVSLTILSCQPIIVNSFFIFFFRLLPEYKKNNIKKKKRRKRDLNPRAAQTTYTLSRGASSASWVFLHVIFFMILSLRLTHLLLYWSVASLSITNLKFLLLLYHHFFITLLYHSSLTKLNLIPLCGFISYSFLLFPLKSLIRLTISKTATPESRCKC